MNNIDLNNRIAVVTGASQGFGYAISKRLVKSGAKVINIDKDPEATAEDVESNFEKIRTIDNETYPTNNEDEFVIIQQAVQGS